MNLVQKILHSHCGLQRVVYKLVDQDVVFHVFLFFSLVFCKMSWSISDGNHCTRFYNCCQYYYHEIIWKNNMCSWKDHGIYVLTKLSESSLHYVNEHFCKLEFVRSFWGKCLLKQHWIQLLHFHNMSRKYQVIQLWAKCESYVTKGLYGPSYPTKPHREQ